MTLQSVIDEKIEVVKKEVRNQEIANFVFAMYKKGIELSEIASIANISIDKVKKIISSKALTSKALNR